MAIKKQPKKGPTPKKGKTSTGGKGDPIKEGRTLPTFTKTATRIVDKPKRASMDVAVGNKGYRMSIDTTNMNKPDEQTYNYIMRDASGKVTSKGNIARSGFTGKAGAREVVNKLKTKK